MKKCLWLLPVITFGFFLLTLSGCRKETIAVVPEVTTTSLMNVTSVSAVCGGDIKSDGGAPILERGVCWNIEVHPTVSNNATTDGEGPGIYSSVIRGLTNGTDYFVRAYATNIAGTAYGNEYHFITPVTDADGNIYQTVIIGTQVWMADNLMTTVYSDSTTIPIVTDNNTWMDISTPAYCWYRNDPGSYKKVYGALYNWFAVNTGKLCPAGWHVPDEIEWIVLTNYLGGEKDAGGKLKEQGMMHWQSPNEGASNDFGFSALPGGYRTGINSGSTRAMGYIGWWWASTEFDNTWARNRTIFFDAAEVVRGRALKRNGYSVRCVKD